MSRVVDLDAFLEEQNENPLAFKFKGREYEAPAEIPWVALQKAQELDGKQASVDAVGDVIGMILGREAWSQMQEDGIGFKAAVKILNEITQDATKGMEEVAPKAKKAEKKRAAKNGSA